MLAHQNMSLEVNLKPQLATLYTYCHFMQLGYCHIASYGMSIDDKWLYFGNS